VCNTHHPHWKCTASGARYGVQVSGWVELTGWRVVIAQFFETDIHTDPPNTLQDEPRGVVAPRSFVFLTIQASSSAAALPNRVP
jgi:hypothetical protein